jgi:hypothetical protein
MRHSRTIIALAALGMLGVPAFGAYIPNPTNPANPPRPGTVNYIEGAAYIDGRSLSSQSVGNTALDASQVLNTGAGKAEILLTPGIFLRVDNQSAVKMISPDLAQTQVELERGRAAVEVDQIFPENMVQIVDNGVTTQLMKTGYYEFDANQPEVMVFNGRAEVELGGGKWEAVKNHHELALVEGAHQKPVDFDSHPADDDLYNWSRLRSQYLAEANNQIAGEYAYMPGFYPGWYWDPYMWDYTFLGWDPFFSPFGWGFYPWGGPLGFYGAGFYGGGFYNHGRYGHQPNRPVNGGGCTGLGGRGSSGNHGLNGGGRGFSRGGGTFGGGFHGGGLGGGFHGGGGGRR